MKLFFFLTFSMTLLFALLKDATASPLTGLPTLAYDSTVIRCGVSPIMAYCLTSFPLDKFDGSDGSLELLMMSKELTDLPFEQCAEEDFSNVTLEECISAIDDFITDDYGSSHADLYLPDLFEYDLLNTEERIFGKIGNAIKRGGRAVGRGARAAGNGVRAVAAAVGSAAQKVGEGAAAVGNAANKVGQTADRVGNAAERVGRAADKVRKAATRVRDAYRRARRRRRN